MSKVLVYKLNGANFFSLCSITYAVCYGVSFDIILVLIAHTGFWGFSLSKKMKVKAPVSSPCHMTEIIIPNSAVST